MATVEIASTNTPVDLLRAKLDEPGVASSLLTLLEHADLLAVLVSGLGEFVARGDTIIESVSASVTELAGTVRGTPDVKLPSASELKVLTAELTAATPVLTKVLSSHMVNEQTIDFLSLASESVVAGQSAAQSNKTSVSGLRAVLAVLRDREVGRGLGLMVEIARALGRRLEAAK